MPDQESIRGQLNLLDTLRKRLRIQIDQKQKIGAFAPPYMQLEIDDAQVQIKQIKAYLRRNGVKVDDQPEDGAEGAHATPDAEPSAAASTADFVIITALEEERDAVLDKLPNAQRHAPGGDIRVYYTADLALKNTNTTYKLAVVSLIGMGRVEAANATNDAIKRWNPQYIIMVGIAGGIGSEGVNIGDIIISNQVADYELQKITARGAQIRWSVHQVNQLLLSAVSNFRPAEWIPHIAVPRPGPGTPKRHIGPVASGDKVIAFGKALASYQKTWPKLIGVEMEAGGVAKAAFQTAQPPGFFMVRGVSDLADEHKGDDWREYACDIAATYTLELLKSGLVPLK